jgi:hypothetical protein
LEISGDFSFFIGWQEHCQNSNVSFSANISRQIFLAHPMMHSTVQPEKKKQLNLLGSL